MAKESKFWRVYMTEKRRRSASKSGKLGPGTGASPRASCRLTNRVLGGRLGILSSVLLAVVKTHMLQLPVSPHNTTNKAQVQYSVHGSYKRTESYCHGLEIGRKDGSFLCC